LLTQIEFTLNFSTILVGSFDIRAPREIFPTEGRRPEIQPYGRKTIHKIEGGS